MPEVGGDRLELLVKLFKNMIIRDGIGNGWTAERSWGFDVTIDANLLKSTGKGWHTFEGKNIHQFIFNYIKPEYTTSSRIGLDRLSKTRSFMNKHKEIHESYRLAIRNISSPTNMRTVIASIIPPHSFHTNSLFTLVLKQYTELILDNEYINKLTYICGILNSMTFDHAARSIVQMNVKTALPSLPIPFESIYDNDISILATKLSVGTSEFSSLAESMRIKNILLTPNKRIETMAMLDALVAHAYDLSRDEYQLVLNSFKFGEDPSLLKKQSMDWSDRNTLRNFYGEVRKLAPKYYDDIGDGKID